MIYVQYQKNIIADVLGKVFLLAEVFEVTFYLFQYKNYEIVF